MLGSARRILRRDSGVSNTAVLSAVAHGTLALSRAFNMSATLTARHEDGVCRWGREEKGQDAPVGACPNAPGSEQDPRRPETAHRPHIPRRYSWIFQACQETGRRSIEKGTARETGPVPGARVRGKSGTSLDAGIQVGTCSTWDAATGGGRLPSRNHRNWDRAQGLSRRQPSCSDAADRRLPWKERHLLGRSLGGEGQGWRSLGCERCPSHENASLAWRPRCCAMHNRHDRVPQLRMLASAPSPQTEALQLLRKERGKTWRDRVEPARPTA